MKKLLITAAALTAIAPSVYASKARILALGDEVEDNYFVKDSRRIFTNAAFIHDYKNQIFVEWGETGAASGALDADSSPKAMGGFLMESGNFVYGAYLGNESNISSSLRIIGTDLSKTSGTSLATADNQLDLFFGGENAGLKWGADFIYTSDEDKLSTGKKREDSAMALKLGAMKNNWEAYANISLKSQSKRENGYTSTTGDVEFDGKLGVQLGGSVELSGNRHVFASAKKFDWDQKSDTTTTEGELLAYRAGYGKTFKVSNTGEAFVRGYYEMINLKLSKAATAEGELKRSRLPLVIGYEAQANSWLTLRGSVSHNLMGKVEGKNIGSHLSDTGTAVDTLHEQIADNYDALIGTVGSGTYLEGERTLDNSTTVAAGASLNFGKLTVDGYIGTTAGSRTGNNNTKNAVLATDNLLTRVGMTYAF